MKNEKMRLKAKCEEMLLISFFFTNIFLNVIKFAMI